MRLRGGFTLVEMVAAILVLAIVGLFSAQFIKMGAMTYTDVAGRQKLLSDTRFAVERLTRDLRDAIPNSARVVNSGSCVEFVPIRASGSYYQLPVMPAQSDRATLIEFADRELVRAGDQLWVYPLNNEHIYNASEGRRFTIATVSAPNASHEIELQFLPVGVPVSYATDSPAKRFYIGRDQVRYCVEGSQLLRYQGDPLPANGVLMADGLTNSAAFRVAEVALVRNAVVLIELDFARAGGTEPFRYSHEVHFPNVP